MKHVYAETLLRDCDSEHLLDSCTDYLVIRNYAFDNLCVVGHRYCLFDCENIFQLQLLEWTRKSLTMTWTLKMNLG